ncbi:MAG TPA: PIN domain-containing protein [Steroidobacteraceae bacterium]|nr:PIN domain-containing protein [Steroidobacteraceae bacterium]
MFLLDTNVAFAAVHRAHEHHLIVDRWLRSQTRFATSGLTQIGLFRLLIAEAPMHRSPLKPEDAHRVVNALTSSDRHTFLGSSPISKEFVGQTAGHRAAFDDYLVQTAHTAGYKLITLDRAIVNRWPTQACLLDSEAQ